MWADATGGAGEASDLNMARSVHIVDTLEVIPDNCLLVKCGVGSSKS